MPFRRCHDEDDVRRRLFENLQQGVEGGRRQHVNFIDDEDLVAVARRRVPRAFAQLADIVDAGVRCCIDFQDVHGLARRDFLAGRALIARRRSSGPAAQFRPLARILAVVVFAHTSRAAKQIRMPDPVELDRVLKCLNDRLLADHFLKDLRPELSCYDLIFHSIWRPGTGDTASHWMTYYRCFLPDLAGFAGSNCTAPQSLMTN